VIRKTSFYNSDLVEDSLPSYPPFFSSDEEVEGSSKSPPLPLYKIHRCDFNSPFSPTSARALEESDLIPKERSLSQMILKG